MLSIYRKGVTESLSLEYRDGFLNEDKVFISGMFQWAKNRINKYLIVELNKLKNRKNNLHINELLALLTDEKIKQILISKPKDLIEIWNNEFKHLKSAKLVYIDNAKKEKTANLIYHIFNYDAFRSISSESKFSGFLLAKKLGVECCPYCNRNNTTTHATYKKKYVFPEFDHFYHKSEYPLLSISFYNLIPSCNVCNTHFKGKKDSVVEKIFHPYSETISNHFNFKFIPENIETFYGNKSNFKIDFVYNDLAYKDSLEKTILFFGLKEIYEICHPDLIREIVNKKLTYSDKYLQIIKDTYGISFEESYRILFETYYEDDELHKRPFSKLKKDIFDDIDIKSV